MKKIMLLILIIAIFWLDGNAQTKNYATSSPSASAGVNTTNSTDSDLATKTRLNPASLSPKFIELAFPDYDTNDPDVDPLPANTTIYFKIAMEDGDLGTLIGGLLGDLLSDALGGLVGNQSFQVVAKNNSTTVLDSNSSPYDTYADNRLRVVADSAGNYYLMITPVIKL